jgi:FkbM family methyltransferase
VRERLNKLAQRVAHLIAGFRQMADWPSRWRLLRLRAERHLPGFVPSLEGPVTLSVKELGGRGFTVRPRTTDADMAIYDFVYGCHLPPAELAGEDLRQILELGANAGAAVASLAMRYPDARVVGVEPDPENAGIARQNTALFADRCELVEAAIWDSDTELTIFGDEAHGLTVRERRAGDPAELPRIRALSVETILREHMPDGPIDFVQMTIEGTEPRVLSGRPPWVERVRSIRMEFHPHRGFPIDDALALLGDLGFNARPALDFGLFVVGVRR